MFGALGELAVRADDFDLDEGATASAIADAVAERFPAATELLAKSRVAVNHEVVERSHVVGPDDEIAILPPVSGGDVWVRLSAEPSTDDAISAIADHGAGATVIFAGTVRGSCELGPVERLEYSAYDAMANKVMAEIASEAIEKWSLSGAAIDHAVGPREPGSLTFVVACAAPRRDEAFEACRYVTDEVKRRAPIWKKEIGPWGARWINL
jgi:molybdopterin synthase catalytic subunit